MVAYGGGGGDDRGKKQKKNLENTVFSLILEESVFSIYHILSSSEDKTPLILQNN